MFFNHQRRTLVTKLESLFCRSVGDGILVGGNHFEGRIKSLNADRNKIKVAPNGLVFSRENIIVGMPDYHTAANTARTEGFGENLGIQTRIVKPKLVYTVSQTLCLVFDSHVILGKSRMVCKGILVNVAVNQRNGFRKSPVCIFLHARHHRGNKLVADIPHGTRGPDNPVARAL